MANNVIITNFTSNVVGGSSPLDVEFTEQIIVLSANNSAIIRGYNWNFNYPTDPWVYTTDHTISHTFVGDYKTQFSIALSADISGTYSGSVSAVKLSAIGTAGIEPIRYRPNRNINLVKFLPSMYEDSEVQQFTQFFEDFLNTMFDGDAPISSSVSDISVSGDYYLSGSPSVLIPYGYSNSAISATTKEVEQENLLYPIDQSKKISIIEKIYRIMELKDPDLIDIEYIQFFAENMGYNVNVYRNEVGNVGDELGNRTASNVFTSATDNNRYLRNMISNLPNWYKIKTTTNAVKVMLYSFGLIGDMIQYYTNDYLNTNDSQWISDYSKDLSNIPVTFFATPHFAIRIDIDISQDLALDVVKRSSVIRAIESIRPINTVFRRLSGYCQRDITQNFSMMTRFTRFMRITA